MTQNSVGDSDVAFENKQNRKRVVMKWSDDKF